MKLLLIILVLLGTCACEDREPSAKYGTVTNRVDDFENQVATVTVEMPDGEVLDLQLDISTACRPGKVWPSCTEGP